MMLPEIKSQPFNEAISMDNRVAHTNIGEF